MYSNLKMTVEWSKRRSYFLSLVFITKWCYYYYYYYYYYKLLFQSACLSKVIVFVFYNSIFYCLQSLICKPPLRDSEDLKQFLGVTGGEQVSFIKPSVAQIVSQSVHVPRVDKVL